MAPIDSGPSGDKAYIVTGPTSGFGRRTALELARHGTVVLAGRDRGKLDDVQEAIERHGGKAVPVVCDLSDPASVRRAAAQIVERDPEFSERVVAETRALLARVPA
jgi:NAD(P)-dependent dehydrogenase (short-subunit alcohol dehydrogenase family)